MGMGTEGTELCPLLPFNAHNGIFQGPSLDRPQASTGKEAKALCWSSKCRQGYTTLISWLGRSDRDSQGTCPEPPQHSPSALSTNLEVSLQRRGSPLGDASSNHRSGVNHGSFLRAGQQGQAGGGRTRGAAGSWGRLPASPHVTAPKELDTSTQQHVLPVPAPSAPLAQENFPLADADLAVSPQILILSGSCSHQLPSSRGGRLQGPKGAPAPHIQHSWILGGPTHPGAGTARPLLLPRPGHAWPADQGVSGKSLWGQQRQATPQQVTARPGAPRAHHLPNSQAADHREDDPADFDHQGLQNRAEGTAHHEGALLHHGEPSQALPQHPRGAPHGTRAPPARSSPAHAAGAHPTSSSHQLPLTLRRTTCGIFTPLR